MTYYVVVIDDNQTRGNRLEKEISKRHPCTVSIRPHTDFALYNLENPPDVVLINTSVVAATPKDIVEEAKASAAEAAIILSHAPDEARQAVQCIRSGAYDYLTEAETSTSTCASVVGRAIETRGCRQTVHPGAVMRRPGSEKLIGTSEAMQDVFDRIGTAAQADMNIVVRGESGTGKELVARTIHTQSGRNNESLLTVDCTTVSASDLEQALFGKTSDDPHEASSQLGNLSARTVLLDDVENLSVDAQAMLNRCLQARTVRRTGRSPVPDDDADRGMARVISLTRNKLGDAVQHGEFRKALYFRLSQFPIDVPPLRERPGDVLPLARHFLERQVDTASDLEDATLTSEAKETLQSYCWPGNVRELRKVIEPAVHLAGRSNGQAVIDADDLVLRPEALADSPLPVPATNDEKAGRSEAVDGSTSRFPVPEPAGDERGSARQNGGIPLGTESESILPIEELKRRAVERAYRLCDGDVDHAAVELDIGRSTMYRMLERYDIRENDQA